MRTPVLLGLGSLVSPGCVGPVGSPPITCTSILFFLCPHAHRSPLLSASVGLSLFFWKALGCWTRAALTQTSTCCLSEAPVPAGSVVALPYGSFPCTCDAVSERRGSSRGPGPVRRSGPNLPHISIPDGGTDARRQLWCSPQELLCEETLARS